MCVNAFFLIWPQNRLHSLWQWILRLLSQVVTTEHIALKELSIYYLTYEDVIELFNFFFCTTEMFFHLFIFVYPSKFFEYIQFYLPLLVSNMVSYERVLNIVLYYFYSWFYLLNSLPNQEILLEKSRARYFYSSQVQEVNLQTLFPWYFFVFH